MNEFILSNGVHIPSVGYGTWQVTDHAKEAVLAALNSGYRHIDTASVYGNEKEVGEALRESGIERKELFITTKVWNTDRGYESTLRAFESSLEKLDLEYVDLYLIHWPANAKQFDNWEEINLATWRAMSELYKAGKIRAIGVSNFMPKHLSVLLSEEIKPMVNQIKYHPGLLQRETVDLCRENDILVEAWSPLGSGKLLADETLQRMAAKYDKSAAQLCIRFCLETGVLPLPKSVTPSRIVSNLEVFDFTISEEDMRYLSYMSEITGWVPDPDAIDF